MGFLDGLCDYDDDEAVVTWSSFWRLESLCSLTALGAAAPFLAALLTFCAVLALWSSSSTANHETKRSYQHLNGSTNDGGREEAKGGDGQSFADSSSAPLLNAEDRSDNEYDEDEEEGESEEGEERYFSRGGRAGKAKRSKKGTGVHWLKLLMYWTQAAYHLGVGTFDLVDGRADDPYKCEYVVLFLTFFLRYQP